MQKYAYFLNALLLPLIPLLFLYNQNSQHLYFPQVILTGLVLVLGTGVHYLINRSLFQSKGFAFLACLFWVVFLFGHNHVSGLLGYSPFARWGLLIMCPILSFVITYGCHKFFKGKDVENVHVFVTIFVCVVLGMNLYPLLTEQAAYAEDQGEFKYKTAYVVDETLPSPNVYWFFVDGMLGFQAMETYFDDGQEVLLDQLAERGFVVNPEAMLEVGRSTSIAIPTLFCPDYHDTYLSEVLVEHDRATAFRYGSDSELYSARVNNETLNAFDHKGYTTTTISIHDKYFLPTTDYYYYIDTYYKAHKDYLTEPKLVKRIKERSGAFDKERIYAHQLGNVFLDGIPALVYDRWFSQDDMEEIAVSSYYDQASDILMDSPDAKINYAMVEGLYDVLHGQRIETPRFVMIHNLMAHWPFHLNEEGRMIDQDQIYDVMSYAGHHQYATQVLVNMIDMILDQDPDAVIILQADHGLHLDSDEIRDVFSNEDAVVDLWNSVFSAVRVPQEYLEDHTIEVMSDPRNISRYLVNRFVGQNYLYLED